MATVRGIGYLKCSYITSNKLDRDGMILSSGATQWALGFLSSLSVAGHKMDAGFRKNFEDTSLSEIQAALKKYCERFPLLLFINATFDVYKQLGGQHFTRWM